MRRIWIMTCSAALAVWAWGANPATGAQEEPAREGQSGRSEGKAHEAQGIGAEASNEEGTGPTTEELLEHLGSGEWRVREDATMVLMNRGPESYEALRAGFGKAKNYEVRRRIRQIVREIYLTDALGPSAFLGIAHSGAADPGADSRIPAWGSGLVINAVFDGTAADMAGLKRGDLVLELNGKRADRQHSALNFTKWIAVQRPGTTCKLGVLRGGVGRRFECGVGGFDSALLRACKVKSVGAGDDARVEAGTGGLAVVDAKGCDGSLGVEAGDLIWSLDDSRLPTEKTEEFFEEWIGRNALKAGPPLPAVAGAGQVPAGPRGSMQILRGGKWMVMTAHLRRRPGPLQAGPNAGRGNAEAVEMAQSAFETWWTESFDPEHAVAEGPNEDDPWRLAPNRVVPLDLP